MYLWVASWEWAHPAGTAVSGAKGWSQTETLQDALTWGGLLQAQMYIFMSRYSSLRRPLQEHAKPVFIAIEWSIYQYMISDQPHSQSMICKGCEGCNQQHHMLHAEDLTKHNCPWCRTCPTLETCMESCSSNVQGMQGARETLYRGCRPISWHTKEQAKSCTRAIHARKYSPEFHFHCCC